MTNTQTITLSVVVPVYNEEEVLPEFHRRISAVLDDLGVTSEVIYANDGSRDGSLALLERLSSEDPRVAIVDLSRNYGKEIALTAGMDHAHGEAVVVIDADLQDPPELIPELVQKWRDGFDMVYAKRTIRDGENWVKKATAKMFYQVIQRMSRVEIPRDVGDFRLMSRRAVDSLKQLREQHRFMKGLFAWIGYPSIAVPYRRDPRFAGETKWNYWKLWNFALEGITSFTIAPLKIASYLGLLTSTAAFVFAAMIIYRTLVYGEPVRGYPTLMVVILFLGAVQLIGIGIIGEYLGRMFDETKRRPLYFVNRHLPATTSKPSTISVSHQQEEKTLSGLKFESAGTSTYQFPS